jgi:hypothetical protein
MKKSRKSFDAAFKARIAPERPSPESRLERFGISRPATDPILKFDRLARNPPSFAFAADRR